MSQRQTKKPLHKKAANVVKRHAALAVVPQRANQFKPHLIRRQGLAIILGGVLLLQIISQVGVFQNILGSESTVTSSGLLAATNSERARAGESPLAISPKLSDAAYLKAQDMVVHQYWAHDSPSGVRPWKWLADADYQYSHAGENLARNFDSSAAVVAAWMNSPSHRDNMLKQQYQEVGFATIDTELDGRPTSLVVAMYGTPASETTPVNVQGAADFTAAEASRLGVMSRVGIALQTIPPLVLTSILLLLVAAVVALVAHAYQAKIPKYMKSTWNKHHGLIKALGLSCLMVAIVAVYATEGQLL